MHRRDVVRRVRVFAAGRGWSLRAAVAHLLVLGLNMIDRQRAATQAASVAGTPEERSARARRAAQARWTR